jgi:hypothetical protein
MSTFFLAASTAAHGDSAWRLINSSSGELQEDHIFDMYNATDGAVWILGPTSFRRLKDGIVTDTHKALSLPHDTTFVPTVKQSPDGSIWLFSTAATTFRYKNGSFTTANFQSKLPVGLSLTSFLDETSRSYFFSTNGKLVFRLNYADLADSNAVDLHLMEGESILTFKYVSRYNFILVVTTSGRVLVINADSFAINFETTIPDLDQDRFSQKATIIVTSKGGIFLISPGAGLYEWKDNDFVELKGMDQAHLLGVTSWDVENDDGTLWVATDNEGLFHFGGSSVEHWSKEDGITGQVDLVTVTSRNEVLVSFDGGHLATIKGGTLTNQSTANAGTTPVKYVFETSDGLVAIASDCSTRIRGESEWTDIFSSPGHLNFASSSPDGSVWINCSSGLRRVSRARMFEIQDYRIVPIALRREVIQSDGSATFELFARGSLYFAPRRAELSFLESDTARHVARLRLLPKNGSTSDWDLAYSISRVRDNNSSAQSPPRAAAVQGASSQFNADGVSEIVMPPEDGDYRLDFLAFSKFGDVAISGESDHVVSFHTSPVLTKLFAWGPYLPVAHIAVWLLLFGLYPLSPTVQALFFWNDRVRRTAGLWYIDAIMTLPGFRTWIFMPFRRDLISDVVPIVDEQFFPHMEILAQREGKVPLALPITQMPKRLKGHVLIRGQSGAGKTYFLRWAVGQNRRLTVYLTAPSCGEGLMKAIASSMPKSLRDSRLLERLVYVRAVDILIDGLNEANADARQAILAGLKEYPRANIVIATQPTGWRAPATTAVYDLLPLEGPKISEYLLFKGAKTPSYRQAVETLLAESVDDNVLDGTGGLHAAEFLSNPFDWDLLVTVLSKGGATSLYNVVRAFFEILESEYQDTFEESFPLHDLSLAAYEARLRDTRSVNLAVFSEVFQTYLIEQRVIVVRMLPQKTFFFRHDKLQDFLIICHLEKNPSLQFGHLDDIRFTGVYKLLASELPIKAAESLQRELSLAAARSREHSIVDAFVLRLAQREDHSAEAISALS